MHEQISVIIPTFNEEAYLSDTIESLVGQQGLKEIIVVDGGSQDKTVAIAKEFSQQVKVILSKRGRAIQMNAGAKLAEGEILFFVHADTLLPKGALEEILVALSDPSVRAGSFFLRFRENNLLLSIIASLTRINFPLSTFGDQGLWLRKEDFVYVGGYPDIPILEDVEIQYPIRELGHFKKLDLPLSTSGRRFVKNG
ncbi:MAG: TIGR04283 family arsenosugar biosynthesis glycosyltransferase, partial [Bacteroidota bacterium]